MTSLPQLLQWYLNKYNVTYRTSFDLWHALNLPWLNTGNVKVTVKDMKMKKIDNMMIVCARLHI